MPRINLFPRTTFPAPGEPSPGLSWSPPDPTDTPALAFGILCPAWPSSNAAVAQESRVRTAWGEALLSDCPLQMLLWGFWKLWETPSVSRGVPCAVLLTRRPPASHLPFPGTHLCPPELQRPGRTACPSLSVSASFPGARPAAVPSSEGCDGEGRPGRGAGWEAGSQAPRPPAVGRGRDLATKALGHSLPTAWTGPSGRLGGDPAGRRAEDRGAHAGSDRWPRKGGAVGVPRGAAGTGGGAGGAQSPHWGRGTHFNSIP